MENNLECIALELPDPSNCSNTGEDDIERLEDDFKRMEN